MPRDLVPELHDVLKLTTLQHDFSDFDPYGREAPDTPTWRGVLQHHCSERFPAYPSDRDTFLLHLADGLVSNFSRVRQDIRQETAWTVHRLWNPARLTPDQRLGRPDEVRTMLKILGSDPSFEDFLARYRHIFETRAEDANPGMNITDLETHVRLAGRFYRFLRGSQALRLTEQTVAQAASHGVQGVAALRQRVEQEWQLHIVKCRPRLLVNPFRARDLSVFACLEEFLQDLRTRLEDNLVFASPEEFVVLSDDPGILEQLQSLAASRSIWLEISRKKEQLKDANLEFDPRSRRRRINPEIVSLYPPLEAAVIPPHSEICQMHKATRVWPDDYLAPSEEEKTQEGKDLLCETCFSIRARPSKLKKLAYWDERGTGDLIWVRFRLDFARLHEALRQLYLQYLRSLDPQIPESRAEVRFSLVAEFQQDYDNYLAELRQRLLGHFGHDRTESVLSDFFCIQAESGTDVFSVLRCFHESAKTFFPALMELPGCPLRVSIAFCPIKHPFFEVWRRWEEQQSEMEITAVGHGGLDLELRNLKRFLELATFRFSKSALHNLAEISRISQELAELRFRAKGERGERETFQRLTDFLPLGLKFEGILTLAKLLGK